MKKILLTSLLTLVLPHHAPTAADETQVPVRVGKVVAVDTVLGKAFIGTVQPARRSIVGTAVAGRVETVFVEPGDLVDDAGKLIEIRLTTIRIKLEAAKADVEVAQQQLKEMVAGPRKEDLRRLEAQVKGAEAVREYASKKFDRLVALSERGASPKGDLEEALSQRAAAEQNLVAIRAEYEAAIAGTRSEQLAQSRAKVTKATEELNRIQDELNEHTIKAPFRGYVVKRVAERGEWLKLGDPIAEIIELDPAEVRLSIPEEYIARVQQGQEVRVSVGAVQPPGGNRGALTGKVFRIVPDADPRSRSFPVHIRIDNPIHDGSPLLKPGMLAKVFLPVGPTQNILAIPQDALVLDRSRAYVFVVEPTAGRTVVRRVKVEAGAIQDALIQVKTADGTNISLGDEVVVEGNERLEPGQAVNVLGVRKHLTRQ